jgi:hypothetical protein
MNRAALGSVLTFTILLPGMWLASGQTVTVPETAVLSDLLGGPVEVGVPELIFVGVPALFLLLMVVTASGHLRERKPPS